MVYYIGIIDIFTEYTIKKKAETAFKSLTSRMSKISSVHPKRYGKRFLNFIKNNILPVSTTTTLPPEDNPEVFISQTTRPEENSMPTGNSVNQKSGKMNLKSMTSTSISEEVLFADKI